ncbi:MAG: hypothetical protein LBK72_11060 [Bifidobacteriaceae bacterium]|nr:hypothetical protein [Bifidobacteriaceae bacterium]
MENPIGRDADEFDRRWNELAEQLESEMGTASPAGRRAEPAGTLPDSNPDSDPAAEPVDPPHDDGVRRALDALADGADPWADSPPSPTSPPGPRDWATVETEEHFEPPVPPPVTAGEPLLVVAWVATFVALVGLAIVVVARVPTPWFVPRALGLLGIAGIATLIWRMPHKRTDSEDNGAQV